MIKLNKELNTINQWISLCCVKLLDVYQIFLSPALSLLFGITTKCRFYPSCSQYARESFQKHPPFKAILLTLKRLSRCHPWHPGGIDNVP